MNYEGGTVRYNIEVEGVDKFKTSLEEVSQEFDRLTDKLADADISNTTRKDLEDVIDNLQHLQKRLSETEAGTEEYDSALISANEQLKYFAEQLGEVADAAEETVEPISGLVGELAELVGDAGLGALKSVATGAATALVTLAKKGVSATNFLETSQIGMSGLLGSMEQGTKALSVAAEFWQNNPFNRFDVTNATKSLVQYGRQVSDLSSDLEILGNVSLSTGVGIDELAYSYGRVASLGKASTRYIEQMAIKGVPIWSKLAEQLGTTQAGVRELAAQGKVDFGTFRKAMEAAVNPEAMAAYENTLARQQDRLSGSISILAGDLAGYKIVNDELKISTNGLYEAWVKLTNTLATGLRTTELREGLTKIGEVLANLMDKIFQFYEVVDETTGKITQHSRTLETVFGALSKIVDFIGEHPATLIAVFGGALSVISRLTAQIPILGNVFGGLSGKISGIVKAFTKLASLYPGVAALIAVFSVGLVSAAKNSESFRESISRLINSLAQIVQNILPAVQVFINAFVDLASSDAVVGVLEIVAAVLADIAGWLSKIPTEVFEALLGVVIGLTMASVSPWMYWGTALALAYSWIKKVVSSAGGLKKVLNNIGTAIHDFFTSIKDYLARFSLKNVGNNFIAGFFNGASEALKKGKSGLVAGFTGLIDSIKNVLGIHSPSTVMYGIGQNMGIGLANGIEDSSSVIQLAMNNLAKDVLSAADKVIGNMSDFGLIDYNGVYKQWKKVANIFTIGSEQYQSAIEKMEEARKQVNLEIINLQEDYNDKLDETIDKIAEMYGIFDEVDTTGGKNATQILQDLDKQVAQLSEWQEAQNIISGLGLEEGLVEEFRNMGVSSVSELSSVANMTTSELEQLNSLWLQKQSIAESSAISQLEDYKNETLDQISELADGIDGEVVNVSDVGGRLVSQIGEGITGALPTLESSFAQLNDYIADAKRQLSSAASEGYDGSILTGDIEGAGTDEESVETAAKDLGETLGKGALIGLAGVLGAGVIKKVLPNLLTKVKSSGIASKLGSIFGGSGSASGAATNVGTSVDLSYLNKSTSQIGQTSSGLSKASEWATTIAKGALAIAAIAVAIAAIAGSIWVIDNALADIDWGTFISKLGMVMVATVAMGAIAAVIGKFAATEVAIGGAIIIELAVDIAAIAAALGFADSAMSGIENWSEFGNKLGMMAVAIGAFAVIDGALGALGPVSVAIAIGGALVLEIAADIIAISYSIGEMDANIPDDLGRVKDKFEVVAEVIGGMTVLQGLNGLLAPLEFLGGFSINSQAKSLIKMGQALKSVDENVPSDLEGVKKKFVLIQETIEKMTESNFGRVLNNVVQSARIKALVPTVQAFGEVAEALKSVGEANATEQDVYGVLSAIKAIVENGVSLEQYVQLGARVADSVAQGVQQSSSAVKLAGNTIQNALWQGVQEKFQDEYQQGVALATQVWNGANSAAPTFKEVGAKIQSNFWWGVQNKMNDEYNQGRAMGERFRQGLYDIDYGNAGWWAVQGFINGAWGKAGSHDGLYNTGRWLAEKFLQGIKDRGEQGSPWKTTAESGRFAVEGLIEGMASMENEVVNEAEALADGITEALNMENVRISPDLSVGDIAPSMVEGEMAYGYGTRGGVVINQNNTNYTEYDVSQNLRDLSWELSKV